VEAEARLVRALAARPNLVAAWFHLGEVRVARGRLADAIPCYRRALEIDPTHTKSYLSLADALLQQGDRAEALRYLRHGVTAAAQPDLIAQALSRVQPGSPSN
jgi:cytochrome c-type biogenesis protein CcmH/NrfG